MNNVIKAVQLIKKQYGDRLKAYDLARAIVINYKDDTEIQIRCIIDNTFRYLMVNLENNHILEGNVICELSDDTF